MARHFVRGNEAGENEMILKAERTDARLQTPAPGPAADEEEFQAGALADEAWGDVNQIVVAFELEEAGNDANDKIVRRDVEAGAPGGVVLGVEKGLEAEAAEDAGVLVRAAQCPRPDIGGSWRPQR